MKLVTVFGLLVFAFIGCSSTKLIEQSFTINAGQSKKTVLKILGIPGNREFNGNIEAWQWCSNGYHTDDFLVVWFYKSKVTGVTTYKNDSSIFLGSCDNFYRTVYWEDAPDVKTEN